MRSQDEIKRVTTELRLEMSLAEAAEEPLYRSVPANSGPNPLTWRIRLSPMAGIHPPVYLELNAEIIIGRYDAHPDVVGLFEPEIADQLGISRRHIVLRPTDSKLMLIDLGSTNGTFLNSTRLSPKLPYTLNNDDRISMGRMELLLSILGRPVHHDFAPTAPNKPDAQTLIPKIARHLTSRMDVADVINAALHLATFHTGARHMSTWLMDEKTGELHSAIAQHERMGEAPTREQRQLAQAASSFAPEVIRTGKAVVIRKEHNRENVKASAPAMDVLFCYPLMVGDVAIGAIAGLHDDAASPFSLREEKILEAVAEFSAISIHNALQFARLRETLIRREKLLTGFSYILSYDVKRVLRSIMNTATQFSSEPGQSMEVAEAARDILLASVQTSSAIDQMIDLTHISQNPVIDLNPVDLLDVINTIVAEAAASAHERMTRLEVSVTGESQMIQGDEQLLYQSLYRLVDNAIRHTPQRSHVHIHVHYGSGEILVTVRDDGPGFPEADLVSLLDHYYRGAASAEEHTGLGLGLEYARTVIEAHRGSLVIRNGEQGGAECIVTLPGQQPVVDELHDTLPRKRLTGTISA